MHTCMYILKVDKSVILNVLVMFAVHVITDFCLFCVSYLFFTASMKRPLIVLYMYVQYTYSG